MGTLRLAILFTTTELVFFRDIPVTNIEYMRVFWISAAPNYLGLRRWGLQRDKW